MSRTGKRSNTGIDANNIHIRPLKDKWVVTWVYRNSTFVHNKTVDTAGLAFQFKHDLLLRENNSSVPT
jgi:hypothetical protein